MKKAEELGFKAVMLADKLIESKPARQESTWLPWPTLLKGACPSNLLRPLLQRRTGRDRGQEKNQGRNREFVLSAAQKIAGANIVIASWTPTEPAAPAFSSPTGKGIPCLAGHRGRPDRREARKEWISSKG
jgi:hypothetical protein